MGFKLSNFISGAAEETAGYLKEERARNFKRERDAVVQAHQEKLAALRSQNQGASSATLAELEHLDNIEDPEERRKAKEEMLALKRGGFSHGDQRYDSAGNVLVDADTTANNKSKVATAETRAKENAKNSSEAAKEAYDNLSLAREKIGVYDEAIAALDSNAGTGAVQKYLPSIRAASIRLDNARKRLGLNNLASFKGSTTEKELDISLDTAIPDNMDEPELKKWLLEQKQRQETQADILQEAVGFLETGTLGEWLEQREKKSESVTPPSTSFPPVDGARKAPDGNWYVQKNGKYYRVD